MIVYPFISTETSLSTYTISIPFFFEPSFDFKMNKTFFGNKKYNKSLGINYDNFLKNSLKKFVEYNR